MTTGENLRIDDLIGRLEKVAESFEKQITDIRTKNESNTERIAIVENDLKNIKECETQAPVRQQGKFTEYGFWINTGMFIIAIIAMFITRK